MQVWPTFIHLPWTLWAAGCGESSSDAAVRAKHLANVARLGAEDAYGLAVAEGEIDGEMQKFFANEVCLEFAAFEFFCSSGKYSSSKSAAYHWRKLSSGDKGYWVDQVDDAEFLKVAFRPWELRKGMSSDLLFAHVFPKTATPPAHGSPLPLARPQHPTTRRVTRDPDVTGDGKVELDGEAEVEVGTADVEVEVVSECESPSPSDSDDSDGESLAYRDQFGKRIKLGSKMPPWAEEAVEERQRPPEASGQQQRVRIFETTDASTLD